MFQHILIAKIKEGTLDSIVKAANLLAEAAKKEPGYVYYNVLQSLESADTLIFVESWETDSDFQAHVNGAPCIKFGEIMTPSLAGAPQAYPCRVLA